MRGRVATAEADINASTADVWAALTKPDLVKQYMFDTDVVTDWQPGSPIVWKGEWEGKSYEDKGQVIAVDPESRLEVTHFSPLTGQDDVPENYHTLLYELTENEGRTHVTLSQDNNSSAEEAEQAKGNWATVLDGLKKVAEGQ